MRLICPNCGAQYEVPDSVIPDSGRDVQCSNCGDTWFQHHPDNDPALTEELDQIDQAAGWQDPHPDPAPDLQDSPDPAPQPIDPPAEDNPFSGTETDPADPTAEPQNSAPKRRQLDPSIAEVLREEAARESQARMADLSPGLETQPNLGLEEPAQDEAGRRAEQARSRMARMRGEPENSTEPPAGDPPAPAPQPDPTSRRDLLPDIDEINSSLRAASERRPAEADDHALPEGAPPVQPAKSGGGFRRGLSVALLLAAFLWCLYLFTPQIAAKVPALEGALGAYVDQVDSGRAWLDDRVRSLLATLDTMSPEA